VWSERLVDHGEMFLTQHTVMFEPDQLTKTVVMNARAQIMAMIHVVLIVWGVLGIWGCEEA
jgi:hypothetical protein